MNRCTVHFTNAKNQRVKQAATAAGMGVLNLLVEMMLALSSGGLVTVAQCRR
ncbi:hypothetical protein OG339_48250 (plasmid) [Streptosporangium sp. NBC_01495]|uniref:hypothetical protein n=1 Tax=Streptosporangium sp. NBC_01495 TaxID=2903899 RepID=UPI002E34D6DB|nr:hypothetical protein [Streptosporangium sp. NBC_01495]